MKQEKQTILKSYIRDVNNNPRGLAVIVRDGDNVRYGFSLLNVTLDKFNKSIGTNIAVNRAKADIQLPDVKYRRDMVLNALHNLETRALKYFKDLAPEKIQLKSHINFGDLEA